METPFYFDGMDHKVFTSVASGAKGHKTEVLEQIASMGIVVSTEKFFANESEHRYTNVWSHKNSGSRLACAREALQNSVDAGADNFTVQAIQIQSDEFGDVSDSLGATPFFVRWQDNGSWGDGTKSTYEMCSKYFLKMDGSSKGEKGSKKTDGGFGVGRFVILFCAPLWMMTCANILVVGTYNCYRILCRKCFNPVKGSSCGICAHKEDDYELSQRGTDIVVNYKFLTSADETSKFVDAAAGFYRFTRESTIKISYKRLSDDDFLSVAHHYEGICVEDKYKTFKVYNIPRNNMDKYKGFQVFVIRTSSGLPMFSKYFYNCDPNLKDGEFYFVELDESITFDCFDQARQSLTGEVGSNLVECMSEIRSAVSLHDKAQENRYTVSSDTCPLKYIGLQLEDSDSSGSDPILMSESVKTVVPGNFSCSYYFRDGKTMDTIGDLYKPSTMSKEVTHIALAWTFFVHRARALNGVNTPFGVGFVFSATTLAMYSNNIFYINPENLLEEVGDDPENFIGGLLARAIHEVCHMYVSNHDGDFASLQTELTTKMLTTTLPKSSEIREKMSSLLFLAQVLSDTKKPVTRNRKRKAFYYKDEDSSDEETDSDEDLYVPDNEREDREEEEKGREDEREVRRKRKKRKKEFDRTEVLEISD
jgi:hypothetical protein